MWAAYMHKMGWLTANLTMPPVCPVSPFITAGALEVAANTAGLSRVTTSSLLFAISQMPEVKAKVQQTHHSCLCKQSS